MKKIILVFGLMFFVQVSSSQVLWQIDKDTVCTWYYLDGDEFNDSELNTNEWSYWYGWGRTIWGNKEQQYYTDGKNHELKNGQLLLYAKREKITAKYIDWMGEKDSIKDGNNFFGYNLRDYDYSAGMIQSKKKYLYGYFEIKFKNPPENGFWPAFWLYGGTPNEEIDWMELKTEMDNKIHVGRHSKKKEENKLRYGIKKRWWGDWLKFKGSFKNDYNIVSGEWTPEYLKYYLNGECIAYTKIHFEDPKHIVANIAVPGKNGSFKPAPDPMIKNSGNFAIDYIRVWTMDPNQTISTAKEKLTKGKVKAQPVGLSASKLKTKGKFHYGSKDIHKNDGITVSLVPQGDGIYHLTVLGKEIPAYATYQLKWGNDAEKESGKLTYGTIVLNCAQQRSMKLELIVKCFQHSVTYQIN